MKVKPVLPFYFHFPYKNQDGFKAIRFRIRIKGETAYERLVKQFLHQIAVLKPLTKIGSWLNHPHYVYLSKKEYVGEKTTHYTAKVISEQNPEHIVTLIIQPTHDLFNTLDKDTPVVDLYKLSDESFAESRNKKENDLQFMEHVSLKKINLNEIPETIKLNLIRSQ